MVYHRDAKLLDPERVRFSSLRRPQAVTLLGGSGGMLPRKILKITNQMVQSDDTFSRK